MSSVISQIVIIDIVFSLDSVITAIGLAQKIGVMIRCGDPCHGSDARCGEGD
jgi:predicted tellurium resistance membrane protein TerC